MAKHFSSLRSLSVFSVAAAIAAAIGGTPALAAKVSACVKNDGSIRIVADAFQCKNNETLLEWNKNGPYGDGSAGSLTVPAGVAVLGDNAQFTNLTIAPGASLFVDPGTVIRCTGTFTNNGRIVVNLTQNWGDVRSFSAGGLYPAFLPPLPGISRGLPFVGELGDATNTREGGFGGRGHQVGLDRNVPLIPAAGGGGGAGRFEGMPGLTGAGGAGGGHLAILAQEGIVNAGVIDANGNQLVLGGGGGGGVILLASAGSVTHSGSIQAKGGAGGSASSDGGPGGGGGGGLVRLVSPSITNTGSIDVTGGPAGPTASPGTITSTFRQGGGGGGASFGSGGRGGDALTTGASTVAFPGQRGQVIQTLADPTSLF